MLIIGRNPINETLKFSPHTIKKILLLDSSNDKKIKEIIKTAERKGIAIEKKSKEDFKKIFNERNKSEGISQGLAAICEEFEYSDLDEIMNRMKNKKEALLVILDEVQDPHNLGAIIRTSAAAGADAVIVSEKNSAKVTHTVIKSSAGAVNFVPVVQAGNIYKTIEILKNNGFTVIGTDSKTDKMLFRYPFPLRCAVLFGSEGYGIRKNIIRLCDDLVKIPLSRRVQSLNVSVAAGIILYEVGRQRT